MPPLDMPSNALDAAPTRTNAFKLGDISSYADALTHFSSIDDRKFLLENLVTLLSRLSTHPVLGSMTGKIQDTLIDILYKDLPHPPSTYLSLLPQNTTIAPSALHPNPVTYAFRNPSGANYNPLIPGLGQAGNPYAKSVPSSNNIPPATLPDSNLVFDTLLKRDAFEEHPGGISALFFAFADLVIHMLFHTDHSNSTINLTSSYLDLSVVYGDSPAQCDKVRNKDGRGRLHEDVFADGRLLFMPPAACALLVLLSRNHNYTAQKILEINENGTYKTEFKSDIEKLAQDDEIFNRARLVNCGYFMQIIVGDYIGAILAGAWTPLSQSREPNHALSPRGEGNVVSIEFNLLYRWHATLSEKDTEWTENLFKELFEREDIENISVREFVQVAREKMIPDPDPRKWTFNKLARGPEGRFKDSDLAKILQDSTSWRAGAYKARGIPEVLRVVEVLGIEQARRWGACSMNDFRRFLGLKPFAAFEDWNPDKAVSTAAKSLYKDIENLELYVGLQAEATKPSMAGAGLCPGYTISRSILADAISLTRGDRYLTVDFTPFNLTTWGYHDCQLDSQDGSYGGMLTKLLFRTLPEYYPPRSAYAHFPFLDPAYMRKNMRQNNPTLEGKYIWTRPVVTPSAENVVVFKTPAGVRAVLEDKSLFPTPYAERLRTVTGHRDIDTSFVKRVLLQDLRKWSEYFAAKTQWLLKRHCLEHIGSSKGLQYVDIVRDVINVLPVHWICEELAGLPLADGVEGEQAQYQLFADVCRYVFLNTDPSNDWRLRESSTKTFNDFTTVVKKHLGSWFLDPRATRVALLNKLYAEKRDAEAVAIALFTEIVPTAAHWSQAVAHILNFYLDDSRVQERIRIAELASLKTPEASAEVGKLIRSALAVDPPVWGVYRTASRADAIVDSVRIPEGSRVFVSLKEANDASPHNPILGIGQNGLLASQFFEATATKVLGHILGLKGLKRAPGTSGKFNRFVESVHGAPQQWYINARADLVPWPESLFVQSLSIIRREHRSLMSASRTDHRVTFATSFGNLSGFLPAALPRRLSLRY
ncbi:heme peroxidase [Mycena amicta]|nr:heme peroxidase [Mycena amicta]